MPFGLCPGGFLLAFLFRLRRQKGGWGISDSPRPRFSLEECRTTHVARLGPFFCITSTVVLRRLTLAVTNTNGRLGFLTAGQ